MSAWRRVCAAFALFFALALPGVAETSSAVEDRAAPRQFLVMLHLAAPHFRPDVNYNGSYDARGADARRRVAEALAGKYGLKVVNGWPMPALGVDCFVMEASAETSLASLEEALARDPRVESVQRMQLFHVLAHNDRLYPLQPAAKAWHLAELHRLATGRHVRVAEVDTGVEVDHPDLAGRVLVQRNFVDESPEAGEAHGTQVAGIIAARADDAIGIAGIAPEADLIALRACWERGGGEAAVCSSFTLARALQFALDRKAHVINLSLGGPRDRLLERLLEAAMSRGITVVGAVDPQARDGGFPASYPGVLAVAGEDVHDAPAGALLAPGRDIPTTTTAYTWGFVTGSSFAAAHVTGLVALLHELDPELRPAELKPLLARTTSGSVARTREVVDACAVVARIAGTCACACALAQEAPLLAH